MLVLTDRCRNIGYLMLGAGLATDCRMLGDEFVVMLSLWFGPNLFWHLQNKSESATIHSHVRQDMATECSPISTLLIKVFLL